MSLLTHKVGTSQLFTSGGRGHYSYSCDITENLNSFLRENNFYSSLYQDASLGLLGIGENSSLDIALFFNLVYEIDFLFEDYNDQLRIERFDRFVDDNQFDFMAVSYSQFYNADIIDPVIEEGSFIVSNNCGPSFPPSSNGWELLDRHAFKELTDTFRNTLFTDYPLAIQAQRIVRWFDCRVKGTAQEESVLNSLGLPLGNTAPSSMTSRPDGFGHFVFRGTEGELVNQPFIVEVKGRYADDIFDYGNANAAQFNNYRSYIRNNSPYRSQALGHGLYLILPADIGVDNRVIKKCSDDNIPLYVSWIEYKLEEVGDQSVTYARVSFPELINFDKLTYSSILGRFLPDNWLKASAQRCIYKTFNYDPALLNFVPWVVDFADSFLEPLNIPSNAEEECEDKL